MIQKLIINICHIIESQSDIPYLSNIKYKIDEYEFISITEEFIKLFSSGFRRAKFIRLLSFPKIK